MGQCQITENLSKSFQKAKGWTHIKLVFQLIKVAKIQWEQGKVAI